MNLKTAKEQKENSDYYPYRLDEIAQDILHDLSDQMDKTSYYGGTEITYAVSVWHHKGNLHYKIMDNVKKRLREAGYKVFEYIDESKEDYQISWKNTKEKNNG